MSLPNHPFFHRMVKNLDKPAVTDRSNITSAPARESTYRQLLTDVILLKRSILSKHPSLAARLQHEDVYISYLSPGGYDFAVAFFTIWALGACNVPLCKYIFLLLTCDDVHINIYTYIQY